MPIKMYYPVLHCRLSDICPSFVIHNTFILFDILLLLCRVCICKGFELCCVPPCGRFWERLVLGSAGDNTCQTLDWSKREKLTSARRETRLSRGFCAVTRWWIGGGRWGNYGRFHELQGLFASLIRNSCDADAEKGRVRNTSPFVGLCQVHVGNLNAGFATDRIHKCVWVIFTLSI